MRFGKQSDYSTLIKKSILKSTNKTEFVDLMGKAQVKTVKTNTKATNIDEINFISSWTSIYLLIFVFVDVAVQLQ